jgi:hypothetical protein
MKPTPETLESNTPTSRSRVSDPTAPQKKVRKSSISLLKPRPLPKDEFWQIVQDKAKESLKQARSDDAPPTRLSQQKKKLTRSAKALSSVGERPTKKRKSDHSQIDNVEYLESWQDLRVPIPGIDEDELVTYTKNWQTIIQIKLGVIGYLYNKINQKSGDSASLAMQSALKELEADLKKSHSDFKRSLDKKFEEFAKQKGKNLLAAFAIVILEGKSGSEYKIIDISSSKNLVNFLDTTDEKAEELCVVDDNPANAQRDFHTETAVCVDLPEIIKQALEDLEYEDHGSVVKKVYIYMDSTKSCCNSCIRKIQQTQEMYGDLPLSFIVNWHQEFDGAMTSRYGAMIDAMDVDTDIEYAIKVEDDVKTDDETPKSILLPMTPIKHKHDNALDRDTPNRTISRVARTQMLKNELEALPILSQVYISGSAETVGNQEIQALFNQHRPEITKMVQSLLEKFLIPSQQSTTSSTLQPSKKRAITSNT